MVLVDSSVWIEHFRSSSPQLIELLNAGDVVIHEFILGELSLAHFKQSDRAKIFERLHALNRVPTSAHIDVFNFSQKQKLAGKGIGWIDCHLLHAAHANKLKLLTLDKNLNSSFNKI